MNNDCLFCKIANKIIPTKFEYEDEDVVAFNDIYPKAPVHILIIPKKHIESVKTLEETDKEVVGEMVLVTKKIAEDNDLQGYKLIVNVGREGGQLVDHLHWHLVSPDVKCEHRM